MSKRPAIDTQKSRRDAERNGIGALIYGVCAAHEDWQCESCTDRSGAEGSATYCAGPGLPVHILRSIAEFDAVVRRQARRS
jgi:hypothetical protein